MRINKVSSTRMILILILVAFVVLNPSREKHQENWIDVVTVELEKSKENFERSGEIEVVGNLFDSDTSYINLLLLSFTINFNAEKGSYFKTFGLLGKVWVFV